MVNTRPYCLYRHTSPSGKTYIGITRREPKSRWGVNGSGYLRNQAYPFSRAILKYGWNNIKHEILFNDLTPEKAKQFEMHLIAFYKMLRLSYNVTDGGDGVIGVKGMLGKKWTEEAKVKLRNSLKGKLSGSKNPMYGKRGKLSPVFGKRGRLSPMSKKVYQYSKCGAFIKEWDSIVDVNNELGYTRSVISAACNNKAPSAYGYKWSHLSPDEYVPDLLDYHFMSGRNRRVYQYDENFNLIRQWESTMDIQRELGYSNSYISTTCRGKTKKAYGFIWSYDEITEQEQRNS